jgi:hypothetical protein
MVNELKCMELKKCQYEVFFIQPNIILNFLHQNNLHSIIIYISICTQKYYQEHFQILSQIKVKEFFTIKHYLFCRLSQYLQ